MMRGSRHGAGMKRELEARAAGAAGATGVALLTALAVAREGAETVVFLYGIGLEREAMGALAPWAGATGGLAAALACAWAIARGARHLNVRTLLRAGSGCCSPSRRRCRLRHRAPDRLDWLPTLADPAWDSSMLLADDAGLGRVLADFAGYRARPTGSLVVAYALFWGVALLALWPRRARPVRASAA
jgi:high-affinity iron transporter